MLFHRNISFEVAVEIVTPQIYVQWSERAAY